MVESRYRQMMTVALAFSGENVLLVRKKKPSWQVDLWNGVGGKAKFGEKPIDCCRREFAEETGVDTSVNWIWRHLAVEEARTYELHVYCCLLPGDCLQTGRVGVFPPANDAGETLAWWPTSGLPTVVGNLRWMIPLALDWRPPTEPVVFRTDCDIREKPTW